MLLSIAKAYSYEMLQFGENKAYAHYEVISVLLHHTQRYSGKFLFWMLLLELHEKTMGSQNYAYVFVKMKWTSFCWYCHLAETKNLFKICVIFLFFSHQNQISNIKTTEIHATCHTLDNLWTLLTTVLLVYQQREKKIQAKNKRICAYVGL